jgi:hypothetical protein
MVDDRDLRRAALIDAYWPGGHVGQALSYEVCSPCPADPCRSIRMALDEHFVLSVSCIYLGTEHALAAPTIWLVLPKVALLGGTMGDGDRAKVVAFWDSYRGCQ